MPLLLVTVILHLPKYSLISSYDLVTASPTSKHIELNKPFLLKLKAIKIIALLDS
jgi:hypothetical protein